MLKYHLLLVASLCFSFLVLQMVPNTYFTGNVGRFQRDRIDTIMKVVGIYPDNWDTDNGTQTFKESRCTVQYAK